MGVAKTSGYRAIGIDRNTHLGPVAAVVVVVIAATLAVAKP